MYKGAKILFGLILAVNEMNAEIIQTKSDRLEGKILEQDSTRVKFKLAKGDVVDIPRHNISAIYDDSGKIIWKGTGFQTGVPLSEQKPFFPAHAIIADFYLGTVTGGFYGEEKKALDAMGIYVRYSDGSNQFATNTLMSFGAGLNYQHYGSARWSTLVSYIFRSTTLRTSAGDGTKYENKSLANEVLTQRHALLIGKELHFYLSDQGHSFDLIGQIGYEFGSYRPLATYTALRTQLTPVPLAYIGPSKMTMHGPTARVGLGFTARAGIAQFRLHGFYQVAYAMTEQQIWNAVEKNSVIHDFYGGISLGVGW